MPTKLISSRKRNVLVLDEIVNRSDAVEAPQTGLTILPVWRDLCASDLYFAKEELTVDDRWLLRTNSNR